LSQLKPYASSAALQSARTRLSPRGGDKADDRGNKAERDPYSGRDPISESGVSHVDRQP
jgi:hypothetical protein